MSSINTREVCLFSGTVTTSGAGPDINMIQAWQAAIISLTTNTVSGTTPTLNVFIENKLGQPLFGTDTSGGVLTGTAIYDDLLAFAQVTTSSTTRIFRVVTGPLTVSAANTFTTGDYAQSDAALTAGSLRIGPLGGQWRIKYTVGGSANPTFAFSVAAQLIPYAT